MDPVENMERKREAQQRLYAQRRRVGQLRSRVIAISLVAFVVLWGVVFAQMATGNDPVLGGLAESAGAPRVASEAIETTAPEEIEPEPEPVTTSQS
jgi:hypothetical protein